MTISRMDPDRFFAAFLPTFFPFLSPAPALRWTAFIVAASAALWLALRRTSWKPAAGWIALAVAGQASTLQLVWAGPHVRLQFFYGWSELLRSKQILFLLAVVLQAAIVLWAARKRFGSRLALVLSRKQAVLALVLLTLAAAAISPEAAIALAAGHITGPVLIYSTKVVLGLALMVVAALNLALAAEAIPPLSWQRITESWRVADRRWLPWACAAWVVLVSCLLAWFALDRMPHLEDEVAYLFQAKYFAQGKLTLPSPPEAAAFEVPFQISDGQRWYNSVPAGWPAVLALGILAGSPWAINPLLGGLSIHLAHVFIRRQYRRSTADATVLLLATSPWLLYLAASYMNHLLTLTLMLTGFIGVQKARQDGSIAAAVAAGLSFGALLHVRPLDAFLVALVAGLWWLAAGRQRLRLAALVGACAAGLAMVGLWLAYNKTLTGDPLLVPINKFTDQRYYPGANRLGFGPDIGNFGWTGLDALPGHGPADVLVNSNHNLYMVNFEMFGWGCGSLLLVAVGLTWRSGRRPRLMWALIAVLWAGLSLYWFSGGPDFGARYWFLMILPFTVLTFHTAARAVERLAAAGASEQASKVWAFVLLASVIGVVTLVPWRALDKYHNYRGIRSDIRRLQRQYAFGHSLVLVRGPVWPDYEGALPFSSADLGRDAPGTIFARGLGPESEARLRSYYSDRRVWVVEGPTTTHGSYRVVEGIADLGTR